VAAGPVNYGWREIRCELEPKGLVAGADAAATYRSTEAADLLRICDVDAAGAERRRCRASGNGRLLRRRVQLATLLDADEISRLMAAGARRTSH